MNGYDWAYWLQVMNFAMGAVVVLAGIVVALGVERELRDRRLATRGARSMDSELSAMFSAHHMLVPELGLTMADGGEQIEASDETDSKDKK